MAIHLGRALLHASCNQPGQSDLEIGLDAPCPKTRRHPRCPYSVLLLVGFTMPSLLPEPRGALTAPFHPYSHCGRFAFCGTFPGVTPAGRYPAPYFHGARTFLCSKSKLQTATIQPTGELHKGIIKQSVKYLITPFGPPNGFNRNQVPVAPSAKGRIASI